MIYNRPDPTVHITTHSGVFRTGWSTLEGIESTPVIQLGASLESYVVKIGGIVWPRTDGLHTTTPLATTNIPSIPHRLDVIANLELQGSGVEDRRAFAHKIAVDLFQCVRRDRRCRCGDHTRAADARKVIHPHTPIITHTRQVHVFLHANRAGAAGRGARPPAALP